MSHKLNKDYDPFRSVVAQIYAESGGWGLGVVLNCVGFLTIILAGLLSAKRDA
jgi:hypothetical protein